MRGDLKPIRDYRHSGLSTMCPPHPWDMNVFIKVSFVFVLATGQTSVSFRVICQNTQLEDRLYF